VKKPGKVLYDWPGPGCDAASRFTAVAQLGVEPYDVAVIGAGVIGCALACELSKYNLRVLLLEKFFDVGEGTSKGNSAIVHTGFDATPGSLESELVSEASRRWPELAVRLKIPLDPIGATLLAIDDNQAASLDAIYEKALANGVDDVRLLTRDEALKLEPGATPETRGGLLIPRESIGDPFATSIAYAEVALANGVDLLFGASLKSVKDSAGAVKSLVLAGGHVIKTRLIANVAGLGSRAVADMYGGAEFNINPRRGQFILYDKFSRPAVNHIILPVPTKHTKGVLVSPTIFGNIFAGPTAEDLPLGSDEETQATTAGLALVHAGASKLYPALNDQAPIGAYAASRCNCAEGSYIFRANDGAPGCLTVTGMRSTGYTSSFVVAERLVAILAKDCGLELTKKADPVDSRPESAWPGWHRPPWQENDRLRECSDYGRMICFCENISRGEILDALNSPLRPRTIDAVKRRTRATMGRCQGFDCAVPVAEIMAEHLGIPIESISKKGPGSEIVVPLEAADV